MRAPDRRSFLVFAVTGVAPELRAGREDLTFNLFQFLARARHDEMWKDREKSVCQQFLHGDSTQFK
jgi:hypothetical protein